MIDDHDDDDNDDDDNDDGDGDHLSISSSIYTSL